MSESKQVQETGTATVRTDATTLKAQDFWSKYKKIIIGIVALLVVAVGGFFIYQTYVKKPKEERAADALFKAEEYYRQDSVKLALNGDGQHLGFIKIIDKFSGTDAANLASFYAGSCYIKLDDNVNAVKYLKDFSTDAKQVQQRAYKLLGDAYADQGKGKEALDAYKKAARHFEKDQQNSGEALFLAAYLADKVLKDKKEAINLYTELKEKYPNSHGGQADLYLAQLGVYNVN